MRHSEVEAERVGAASSQADRQAGSQDGQPGVRAGPLDAGPDADVVAQATSLRNDVNRRVFIETSVLLAMLLLAILFAWLVARSMARSLRELRQGALSVAQFGLPHAVNAA